MASAKTPAGKMGFTNPDKNRRGKVKRDLTYQHIFRNIIPGDVCIAFEKVLSLLKLDFEEVTRIKERNFGEPLEIPFVRYETSEGIEVPYGSYYIEGLGEVNIEYETYPTPQICAYSNFEAKSDKIKARWEEIVKLTAELATNESIFRGRAIKVNDPHDLLVPSYMDLDDEVNIFLNRDLEDELETCLFWPLANRDRIKQIGISQKFGVILEGHYGAGKSLILYKAAQVAQQNGWGVLHVGPGMMYVAMMIGKLLEPITIIVEDIDLSTHGDRDRLTTLINSISSVTTKSTCDYALVVSTNFIDRIDPALLRPDRFDRLIKMDLPNEETVERMVTATGNGQVGDISDAIPQLANKTPAIIAEIVKRSKIDVERKGGKIDSARLLQHLAKMERQVELAMPEYRKGSKADLLYEAVVEATNKG